MAIEGLYHRGLLTHLISETFSLIRNWRHEADRFIVLAATVDPVALGVKMKVATTAFKVRLQRVTDLVTRNQAVVQTALALEGVTLAQANTLKTTLIAAADHTLAATLTTEQQVIDEANAILAALPDWDGIF